MASRDFFHLLTCFPSATWSEVRTTDPFQRSEPLWLILAKIRIPLAGGASCRQGKSTSETDLLRAVHIFGLHWSEGECGLRA